MFKSYYVVWKLFCTHISPWNIPSFKSYYVVWKRSERGRSSHAGG